MSKRERPSGKKMSKKGKGYKRHAASASSAIVRAAAQHNQQTYNSVVPKPWKFQDPIAAVADLISSQSKKYWDVDHGTFIPVTTPLVINVNTANTGVCSPTIGNSQTTRIGNSIRVEAFELKGYVFFAGQDGGAGASAIPEKPSQCDIYVVLDTDPKNQTALSYTDIWKSVAARTFDNMNMFRELGNGNGKRFKIIKHIGLRQDPPPVTMITNAANTAANSAYALSAGNYVPFEFFTKLDFECCFSANTGSAADNVTNQLYIFISHSTGGNQYDDTLTFRTRIRFRG